MRTDDVSELRHHPIFRTDHYAGTALQKVRRSLELGPRYYVLDVPRYWIERRQAQLAARRLDLQVLWNPLHEFGLLGSEPLAPPPGLMPILDQLSAVGMTITLKPERFLAICTQWWRAAQGRATIIECGSYRGTTGLALALLGLKHGFEQDVHLFDLFGKPIDIAFMPIDGARQDNEFEMEADYAEELRNLARKLGVGDRVTIHAGLFSDTFPHFVPGTLPIRFAHIDANLYASTKQACAFLKPILANDAVVVFDDYHGITDLGARLAVDEIFTASDGVIRRLSGTSAFLTRTPA